jgi:hypothetical protein
VAESHELQEFRAGSHVAADVFDLRPDYRVLLLAVTGIVPGPSDDESEGLLRAAEAPATEARCARTPQPRCSSWTPSTP